MGEIPDLIVKSAVRKFVNEKECNVSSEVVNEALSMAVAQLLERAIERAKGNNRKTVMPQDL
ncbi:MAG: histone-like protein [Promethearchaeota archaeon]